MASQEAGPAHHALRCRRLRRCGRLVGAATVLVGLAAGCGTSTSALDRAADEVNDVVADIEGANPPTSYRFTYTAISPLFMACMSGVEDVGGVVDAEASVVGLTTLQRGGDVYSLDGELLIHRDLLGLPDNGRGDYARIPLNATTAAATRNRIDKALGTSLSALIGGGAWPNHPSDTVLALIPLASTITSIDPDRPSQRAIRFVLDPDAYTDQIEATTAAGDQVAPIIDVHVATDGTVQRLVARLPDPADPTTVQVHSDGYAMDYAYDPQIDIAPPSREATFDIAAQDLPAERPPIPCQLEQ